MPVIVLQRQPKSMLRLSGRRLPGVYSLTATALVAVAQLSAAESALIFNYTQSKRALRRLC